MTRKWAARAGDPLTAREEAILESLADGRVYDEIAADLHVSVNTVKDDVSVAILKLGARNRTHAVALAYHTGILIPKRAVA